MSVLFLVAAVGVTLVEGTPERLPGVAPGSHVLLHLERVAALLGIGVAIATVLLRAARGRLPIHLSTSGVSYEADTAETSEATMAELQGQLARLEERVALIAEQMRHGPSEDKL